MGLSVSLLAFIYFAAVSFPSSVALGRGNYTKKGKKEDYNVRSTKR